MSYQAFVRASSNTYQKPINYILAPDVTTYDFNISSPIFSAHPIENFTMEEIMLNAKIGNIGLPSYHKISDYGKQYNLSFTITPHDLSLLKLITDPFIPGTTIKILNLIHNQKIPNASGLLTDYFFYWKGILLNSMNFRVSPDPGTQTASFNAFVREVKQGVTAHGLTTPTFKEFADLAGLTPRNHKSGGANPLLINATPIPYKDFTLDFTPSPERERLGGDEFDSAYTPLNLDIRGTIVLKKGLNQPFLNLLNTAGGATGNTNTIVMKIGGGGSEAITLTEATIERASYDNAAMPTKTDDVTYSYVAKAIAIA